MLALEAFEMAEKGLRYTPEFRRQMVDLSRSGRSLAALSKEVRYGTTLPARPGVSHS